MQPKSHASKEMLGSRPTTTKTKSSTLKDKTKDKKIGKKETEGEGTVDAEADEPAAAGVQ